MLLERASALAAKISRHQSLKKAAAEADMLRTRAGQVRQAAAALAEQRSALRRLEAAGVAVSFRPTHPAPLVERAQGLKAVVKENPAGLADPSFNLKYEFTDRLKGIADAARQTAEKAWRAHVLAQATVASDEVLQTLGRLPPLRAGVTRILNCRNRTTALSQALPTDPNAANRELAQLVSDQRAAWNELTADDIPPAVIGFLRSCGNEGASLSAFSGEVRTWLEGRNLLGAFRIRIL
ncbi:hypothetical protein [Rubellimicrobium roseum]|uniref:Uncharacterized protein n=1 Tax=Rubellimicrobium roseum TaxID=687525 RepID=A0A5C4NMJ8_9RHOB|nr:hypothetical protein [Rubellimicrobium roseum]TNC74346.1 hypothetical protein FHG71_03975 [Rubellimicrobium roseum]